MRYSSLKEDELAHYKETIAGAQLKGMVDSHAHWEKYTIKFRTLS